MEAATKSISNKFWDAHQPTTAKEAKEGPNIKYLARRNPFCPIDPDMSLFEAACKLAGKVRRLPVMDSNGRVCSIISRTSLVQFLDEYIREVGVEANQTIEQTNLGIKEVKTVEADMTAREAFEEMDRLGLSGVAVVSRDGVVAGATSARDLQHFLLDRGSLSTEQPMLDYLAAIRQREISATDRAPMCSVGVSSKLARVIGLLAATKYHRVFVLDSLRRPVGVVSITDLLKYVTASQALPLLDVW